MNTQILLLNPETKKQDTFANIEKIYGSPHADNLLRAKEENRELTFTETRAFTIRHNSIRNSLPAEEHPIKEPERVTNDEQKAKVKVDPAPTKNKPIPESFIQLFTSMTNNTELLKIMRKCMTLYLYLAGNINRLPDDSDYFNLYENYYKKGKLAVTITGIELNRRLGIDRGIISGYVKHMEKHGIIKIDKKQRISEKGTKEHNIYILGTVEKTKKGKDVYSLFINKECWKTQQSF